MHYRGHKIWSGTGFRKNWREDSQLTQLADRPVPHAIGQALIVQASNSIEPFPLREGGTVDTLTGGEAGIWHVSTRDSLYIFDFEHGTVERRPGRRATPMETDRPQRLRTLDRCTVGERGYWTMKSYDHYYDYYWRYSSIIRRIEQVISCSL